jgi:hypothetical protein
MSTSNQPQKGNNMEMTPQQAALARAAQALSNVIEAVVPPSSTTAHYMIESLRLDLRTFLSPYHRAYAGRVVTKDAERRYQPPKFFEQQGDQMVELESSSSREYAPWIDEENIQYRIARLSEAYNRLAGPGWNPLPAGDPRRPRLAALCDAIDRLELTRMAHNGDLARVSFNLLSQDEKADLCEEVFKLLEYAEDGTPGNTEWNADTSMRLGQAFARFDVKFTDPTV